MVVENAALITGIIGVITTFASGFTGWFFARKKYNSEVDNNLIANMRSSLEFYRKLSDDNTERLDEVLQKNKTLELEVQALRAEVEELRAIVKNYTIRQK